MGKRRLHTDDKQLTEKCNANKTALATEAPSLIWNIKHAYWSRMQPNFSCKLYGQVYSVHILIS